ncbi:hypothetical protein C5S30_05185 [ANME-1 cluster archaeon GoMg4]|nr:hypothetical protein [ANME-1 cluster archaeon GoMg4]
MKKVYATLVLLFFVIGMIPVINAQENLSLISPQKQIVAIKGQEKVELKSNQVLTVANRSVVAVEQNTINIERTSQPVLVKPTEDFVSIANTSLDIKQMEEPLISVEIETPELTNKVEIKKEAQELSITADNVTAFTTNELEIKDAKLYLVHDEKALEIKVLPVVVSERVKRIEPQLIEKMELKVEDNKPVYKIKSVQSVEVEDGVVNVEIATTVDAETGVIKATQKQIKKNGQLIEEAGNELLVVENNKLVKLDNVADKELKREKLLANSVKPLVAIEKIERPLLKKERFILQTERDCVLPLQAKELLVVRTDNYDLIVVETDNLKELIENEGVLKVGDESEVKEFVNYSREVLAVESEEKIRKLELKKNVYDVVEIPELKVYMADEGWEAKEGQVSPYQQFVTPDAVKDEVAGLTKEQIYEKAKSFVWVSDPVLHNKREKWLSPADFLVSTPAMDTNPVKGAIVSDCSEQANTLVSMLRASGVPAEDVRVVLGKVNFGGEVGGHAWVELKEDGKWHVLEATSGPFYDEERGEEVNRNGVSYDYWKYHEYPVVEVWTYYNDKYFTDEKEEVASGWSEHAETVLEEDIFGGFAKHGFDISGIFGDFIEWLKGLFG